MTGGSHHAQVTDSSLDVIIKKKKKKQIKMSRNSFEGHEKKSKSRFKSENYENYFRVGIFLLT